METVDRVITDQRLMHEWLNPLLVCEPVGPWSSAVGAQSCFKIQLPLWQPTLASTVVERSPGLVVWEFDGFFKGRDRWACQAESGGTLLVNQFTFQPANPWVAWGFCLFAAQLTKRDMEQQLQRLKRVAEAQPR
ncbi:SRPBCC family protein [Lyngbya confervoides BDU141951]|uniref:SRPBCC family protein n=2 Tax=Lyngbya TaxID=28073 RepID=A0ABD4SYC6_9CYAN|nr:SRPBCC family protein [Lyngbya confervoides BDU141951]